MIKSCLKKPHFHTFHLPSGTKTQSWSLQLHKRKAFCKHNLRRKWQHYGQNILKIMRQRMRAQNGSYILYGLLDACPACNKKYTAKWIAEEKVTRVLTRWIMWNVRKKHELNFLPRIINSEKINGNEVNVFGVANKMNIFTINSGHTGKWNDCKEKRKVYSITEGLKMLDKVFGIVVTVRTHKSLNTRNACFPPSFLLYNIFLFSSFPLAPGNIPCRGVLPSQLLHFPPSTLFSVLLISHHSSDTHSPSHPPFLIPSPADPREGEHLKPFRKCNLKAYRRHPSIPSGLLTYSSGYCSSSLQVGCEENWSQHFQTEMKSSGTV